ncbi:MAG TPA: hypothetical protein VH439_08590 [Gemmatimonadales bacterium]
MKRHLVVALIALLASGRLAGQNFDHPKHARLFPTCTACHAGAEDPDSALYPSPARCAACHDGAVQPRVAWQPPAERPSNLKFVHDLVPLMTRQTPQGPQELTCADCHTPEGAPWMTVQRPQPDRCMQCHAPGFAHASAPDTLCSTCHIPLVRAASLRAADIAAFPKPPSHEAANWVSRAGHGKLAAAGAQSCAVCHARDFCQTCHVDAPEQAAIQALDPDPRSRAIVVQLTAPASHQEADFLQRHGRVARADIKQCSTCHTRESCLTCHAPSQRVSVALYPAGPGRAPGAQPHRARPPSHRENFARRHASFANSAPGTCAGCHVRTDCLECHRQSAAAGPSPGYHPAGFLTRHPAAAYARESRCTDCHNTGAFCQSCHATAGLVATKALGSGYHDASRTFSAGHGQAARQSLESCTACHVERDCLTCHSSIAGRGYNPHGPGFDAERLRRKNAQMCTVCHGAAIPDN